MKQKGLCLLPLCHPDRQYPWEVTIFKNHVYVLLIILIRIMMAKLIYVTNGNPEKCVGYYVKRVKKREKEEKI